MNAVETIETARFARVKVNEQRAAELRKQGRVVFLRAGAWWCDLSPIGSYRRMDWRTA